MSGSVVCIYLCPNSGHGLMAEIVPASPSPNPLPLVIGICGYANVGKDTLANYLSGDHGYMTKAFADKLRELILLINPVVGAVHTVCSCANNGIKQCDCPQVMLVRYKEALQMCDGYEKAKRHYPIIREMMVSIGNGVKSTLGENIWVDSVIPLGYGGGRIVVTDVRYPVEEKRVRDLGGIIIGVERPGVGPANEHEAKLIPEIRKDFTVRNDGSLEVLRYSLNYQLSQYQRNPRPPTPGT